MIHPRWRLLNRKYTTGILSTSKCSYLKCVIVLPHKSLEKIIRSAIRCQLADLQADQLKSDPLNSGVADQPLVHWCRHLSTKFKKPLSSMPVKSSSPTDWIPTIVLKSCADVFAPLIARLTVGHTIIRGTNYSYQIQRGLCNYITVEKDLDCEKRTAPLTFSSSSNDWAREKSARRPGACLHAWEIKDGGLEADIYQFLRCNNSEKLRLDVNTFTSNNIAELQFSQVGNFSSQFSVRRWILIRSAREVIIT